MIHTLDLKFKNISQAIASFLIETEAGPALIETGPYSTYNALVKAVKAVDYDIAEIQHIFLTHIHFDHAGAAWAMAEKGATVYVHPKGFKHLNDPSKLYASAKRIYQDEMDSLWGDLKPIDKQQLKTVEDGEIINLGNRKIKALHTPGHAVHHIAWQIDDIIFTGDVAGVKILDGPVVPPCPPPDIHLGDWEDSIDRIVKADPQKLYLTHFGEVSDVHAHLNKLNDRLHLWANWIRPHWEEGKSADEITPEFQKFVRSELKKTGIDEECIQKYEAANPSWMSVAGLLRYWQKELGKND